jgi:hypothetical protein
VIRTGATLILAATLLACTEPNPAYQDGGCAAGQRMCNGQSSMVCLPAGSYSTERICPAGSVCQSGMCIGAGQPCSGTCAAGQVCTALVAPTLTSLATYCVAPVGARPGTSPCTKDSECQSGLCLKQGYCYRACAEKSCGLAIRCVEVTLTLSGVQGKVHGCIP